MLNLFDSRIMIKINLWDALVQYTKCEIYFVDLHSILHQNSNIE